MGRHACDLDFSPDGSGSGSCRQSGRGMEPPEPRSASNALLGSFTGHVATVSTVDFSPANDEVLSGSSDGTIRIWDARTFTEARRFSATNGEPSPPSLADGRRCWARGSRVARIWDAVTTNTSALSRDTAPPSPPWLSRQRVTGAHRSSDKSAICGMRRTVPSSTADQPHPRRYRGSVLAGCSRALTASSDERSALEPRHRAAVASAPRPPFVRRGLLARRLYIRCGPRLAGMTYLWDVTSRRLLQTFRPSNADPSTTDGVASLRSSSHRHQSLRRAHPPLDSD